MGVPERIKSRRQSLRLEPKALAVALRLSEGAYRDVESDEDELCDVVEFSTALELARLLSAKLLTLIGEDFDYAKGGRINLEEVRELIVDKLEASEIHQDELSWDIEEFLDKPEVALEYPLFFLKLLGSEIGFDWRAVVANYEAS